MNFKGLISNLGKVGNLQLGSESHFDKVYYIERFIKILAGAKTPHPAKAFAHFHNFS